MRYKITITEIGQESKLQGNKWAKLSDKEGGGQYGYTPEVRMAVNFEREIFSQSIEELDLSAVIRAVNEI